MSLLFHEYPLALGQGASTKPRYEVLARTESSYEVPRPTLRLRTGCRDATGPKGLIPKCEHRAKLRGTLLHQGRGFDNIIPISNCSFTNYPFSFLTVSFQSQYLYLVFHTESPHYGGGSAPLPTSLRNHPLRRGTCGAQARGRAQARGAPHYTPSRKP